MATASDRHTLLAVVGDGRLGPRGFRRFAVFAVSAVLFLTPLGFFVKKRICAPPFLNVRRFYHPLPTVFAVFALGFFESQTLQNPSNSFAINLFRVYTRFVILGDLLRLLCDFGSL